MKLDMRVRTKLLILLLAISLVPMLLLRCKNQRTASDMGQEIAARIRAQLIQRSSMELRQQVADHAYVMLRERQLLQLALRTQASALEKLLAGAPLHPPVGRHKPLNLEEQAERHCRLRGSNRCPPSEVSYDSFAPLTGNDTAPSAVAPLTPVFKSLAAHYDDLLLWQYVFLPDGGQEVYPATSLRTMGHMPPQRGTMHGHGMQGKPMPTESASEMRQMGMDQALNHMGMQPGWHLRALESDAPVWGRPHTDPLTRKPVITVAMLVRAPSGEPVASTAIVVEVGALLRVDDHLDALSSNLQTMMVLPATPSDTTPENLPAADSVPLPPGASTLRVLARQSGNDGTASESMGRMRSWRVASEAEWLDDADQQTLAAIAADMRTGTAGVREGAFKGRESLWAYGPIEPGGLSLLLIAPKEDLVAEAERTRDYVLRRFQQTIVYSGVIMALGLAVVVVLALTLSRRLTRNIEELAQGFERVGHGDFSVRVNVRSGDEIGRLAQGFNTMVPALEERIQMRQALEVAHEIQRSLLPQHFPEIPGFALAGRCAYSETTGGDYFDYIPAAGGAESQAIGLTVGDVTGHGLPAALLMTTARALLRQRASMSGGPAEVMADVNRQLSGDVDQTGRFMTLFYAVLDPQTRELRWARAGHDPGLLYSPDTDDFQVLAGQGLPLGTLSDWEFEEQHLLLKQGQLLCLATDGLFEAENPQKERYGKQRLQHLLRVNAAEHPETILQNVLKDLQTFRGNDSFDDDVTLLLLKAL